MTITDYGVPLLIGGKKTTLSVLMYNKAVGMLDYGTGSTIGVILLIPALAAFFVDILNPENGQNSFVAEPVNPSKSKGRDLISLIFSSFLGLCVLLPVFAFCIMVFETKYPSNQEFTLYHIEKTMNRGAGEYLLNSLMYALLTGIFGTVIAF